jgi:hypothetical protein
MLWNLIQFWLNNDRSVLATSCAWKPLVSGKVIRLGGLETFGLDIESDMSDMTSTGNIERHGQCDLQFEYTSSIQYQHTISKFVRSISKSWNLNIGNPINHLRSRSFLHSIWKMRPMISNTFDIDKRWYRRCKTSISNQHCHMMISKPWSLRYLTWMWRSTSKVRYSIPGWQGSWPDGDHGHGSSCGPVRRRTGTVTDRDSDRHGDPGPARRAGPRGSWDLLKPNDAAITVTDIVTVPLVDSG